MKKYLIAMMAAVLLSMPTMAQKGKAKSLEVSLRKTFNTASMLQKIAEGAASVMTR